MSGALRICFVTGEYPPDEGGVADYTRCLAEALVARGVAVDVVTGRTRAERSRVGGMSRVTVHRVINGWGWSSLRALRSAVAAIGPDVVHVQYQTAAFRLHPAINLGLGRLGRAVGARTAITYHDLREPYLFPKAGPVRTWVTRRPAETADLAIATNAQDYATLAAWGGARRLALVPIGANVPDAPPAGWSRETWRGRAGLPVDAAVLVYFGFLNPSKGGRTLLAALGRLVAQGRDVRLIMLGGTVGASDGTNATELLVFREEAAAAGLGERIVWTGHLPTSEVSAWFRSADVAVLPYADGASYRRGSLLAAIEHGCAIVTTWPADSAPPLPPSVEVAAAEKIELPSKRDVADAVPPPLQDGVTARLVEPADPESLAAAVAEVLDDPALASRLSAGARRLAAHFGWDGIAVRHEAEYRGVVRRGA